MLDLCAGVAPRGVGAEQDLVGAVLREDPEELIAGKVFEPHRGIEVDIASRKVFLDIVPLVMPAEVRRDNRAAAHCFDDIEELARRTLERRRERGIVARVV